MREISSAARATSCAGSIPPVGLCGELRITSLVRSLSSASSAAGSNAKSRSSSSGSGTGRAPNQRIADS